MDEQLILLQGACLLQGGIAFLRVRVPRGGKGQGHDRARLIPSEASVLFRRCGRETVEEIPLRIQQLELLSIGGDREAAVETFVLPVAENDQVLPRFQSHRRQGPGIAAAAKAAADEAGFFLPGVAEFQPVREGACLVRKGCVVRGHNLMDCERQRRR